MTVMGRRREYNQQKVREGTLQAFLQKGFADTSLGDLEAASGLDRRQLYDGLGDKKAMFVTALRDFSQSAGREFLSNLEDTASGLDAIRGALQSFVDLSDTPRGRLGCLICNSSREAIAQDTGVQPIIDDYFRRIEDAYHFALVRAAGRHEISTRRSRLRQTARFLFGIHVSICVLARAGENKEVLQDIVDGAVFSIS